MHGTHFLVNFTNKDIQTLFFICLMLLFKPFLYSQDILLSSTATYIINHLRQQYYKEDGSLMFPAVLKPWPFQNGQIIYLAVLKPSLVLKRPGQFKTWFQNGQIKNLAILKPHLISKFFYSMCFCVNFKSVL